MKHILKSKVGGSICIGQWTRRGTPWTFCARAKRDATAAERFLRKTLNAAHTQEPRVINVDKNTAYPPAVDDLKADEQLPKTTELRQVKYLNNRVEQDHRFPCATDQTRIGIWVIQHGTTNFERV